MSGKWQTSFGSSYGWKGRVPSIFRALLDLGVLEGVNQAAILEGIKLQNQQGPARTKVGRLWRVFCSSRHLDAGLSGPSYGPAHLRAAGLAWLCRVFEGVRESREKDEWFVRNFFFWSGGRRNRFWKV